MNHHPLTERFYAAFRDEHELWQVYPPQDKRAPAMVVRRPLLELTSDLPDRKEPDRVRQEWVDRDFANTFVLYECISVALRAVGLPE